MSLLIQESLLSVVCLLLWLLGSSFISAVLEIIDNTYFARYIDLDTLILRLGNVSNTNYKSSFAQYMFL